MAVRGRGGLAHRLRKNPWVPLLKNLGGGPQERCFNSTIRGLIKKKIRCRYFSILLFPLLHTKYPCYYDENKKHNDNFKMSLGAPFKIFWASWAQTVYTWCEVCAFCAYCLDRSSIHYILCIIKLHFSSLFGFFCVPICIFDLRVVKLWVSFFIVFF